MRKKTFIKKIENFEMHHKILVFIIIMCLTIIISRLSVMVYNPNPVILNFELHHFDYGILLLLLVCLFLLFGKKRYSLYLFLSAIAFGLVLDELWFIRANIVPEKNNLLTYITTLPSVIVFVIIIILIIFFINHFRKRRK